MSYVAFFSGSTGRSMYGLSIKLAVLNLNLNVRNQQRPTLEGIDMEYGRFNQQKIIWNITCVTSESKLLFWRLDVANFREKNELVFAVFAGPVL